MIYVIQDRQDIYLSKLIIYNIISEPLNMEVEQCDEIFHLNSYPYTPQ